MEWIEVSPLPEVCQKCEAEHLEEDCYNCDYAGLRWVLPRKEELLITKKGIEHNIARLQKRLEEVIRELESIE